MHVKARATLDACSHYRGEVMIILETEYVVLSPQVLDGNLSPKEAVDAVMNLPQMEES